VKREILVWNIVLNIKILVLVIMMILKMIVIMTLNVYKDPLDLEDVPAL
jgi:hypothetical protein